MTYKAKTPLEKAIGQMVRSQGGPWLSEKQMAGAVAALKKKGITKPGEKAYDDIARVVGKLLSKHQKGEARMHPTLPRRTRKKTVFHKQISLPTPSGGSRLWYNLRIVDKGRSWDVSWSDYQDRERFSELVSKSDAKKRAWLKPAFDQAGVQMESVEEPDEYITEAVKDNLVKMLPWADDPEFGGTNAI